MNNIQEDTLIKIWNRLEDMWCHHQDGSDFLPTLKGEEYLSEQNQRYIKNYGNDSVLFDIIFNELQHEIRNVVSPERQKELK